MANNSVCVLIYLKVQHLILREPIPVPAIHTHGTSLNTYFMILLNHLTHTHNSVWHEPAASRYETRGLSQPDGQSNGSTSWNATKNILSSAHTTVSVHVYNTITVLRIHNVHVRTCRLYELVTYRTLAIIQI